MSSKLYIGNAFSLSMLDAAQQYGPYARTPRPLGIEQVKKNISMAKEAGIEILSCIGHADTALLLGQLLDFELPVNRISVKLEPNASLIVGQYIGPRLVEGTTVLPEGARFEWWVI